MKTMRSLLVVVALFCVPVATPAQDNIHYQRLERETILKRLQDAVPQNSDRRKALAELFFEAGCRGEDFTEQPVPEAALPNLICTLPGETDSMILAAAHYDAPADAPGVADNWTGAALLPSLYQSIKGTDRKHTYVFAALAGGADGHTGAKHYADLLDKETREKYRAAVVLNTLGMSFTRGWSDNRLLVNHLRTVSNTIQLPVEFTEYKDVTHGARPFEKEKVPSITIHSVNEFNYDKLRDGDDTVDRIERYEYYESYMMTAMFLAYLDLKLE